MPITTIDPIVQRLNALAQESPDLKDAARVYAVILPLLRDADLGVGTIKMTEAQAREKLSQGLPLLHEINLELDVQAVRDLMILLSRALEESIPAISPQKHHAPWSRGKATDIAALYESAQSGDSTALRAAAVRQIHSAFIENRLDVSALMAHLVAGDSGYVSLAAQAVKLDPGMVWILAQNAMKPALNAWRQQLVPLAREVAWQKGYCFVCGAAATLGELQGNDQERHLRCGQCGTDWQFPRLQCPFCGNVDHQTLGYLYPE